MRNYIFILSVFFFGCNSGNQEEKAENHSDSLKLSKEYFNLSRASIKQQNYNLRYKEDTLAFLNAIQYLESAIRYDPNNYDLFKNLVDLMVQINLFDEASQRLCNYIKLFPEDAIACMYFGMINEYMGKIIIAKEAYNQAYMVYANNKEKDNANYLLSYYLLNGTIGIDSFINSSVFSDTLNISLLMDGITTKSRCDFIRSILEK